MAAFRWVAKATAIADGRQVFVKTSLWGRFNHKLRYMLVFYTRLNASYMRSDITKGVKFPDYELPDHKGKRRKLSELQGNDPVALLLARGGYCPKEHLQHQWLAAMQPEIKVGYCRIITISTDTQLESKEWRNRLGAHWPFLSDRKRVVQQDLDIQEYTDPGHDPMIPYTILLEPGLVVYKIYNGYWYWGRPTPEEIRQDFRAISKKCRPDWDLADPQVMERWEKGEKSFFYPYESFST
jgi:peroxiredoxin